MSRVPVVCLCDTYDLKAFFGKGFTEATPELELLRPDEVADPHAVRHAFAFWPGPDAFSLFPNVRLVCTPGAGVDGLVGHPGLRSDHRVVRMLNPEQGRMMAGFAAYHVVGWHRDMWGYPGQQAREEWVHRDLTPPGRFPVGVLGFGEMGRAIAEGIAGLGYPVTAWATRERPHDAVRVVAGEAGLATLLSESRAVINVLPLTPETRGLLDAGRLSAMRPDAMLLQIGRGAHLVQEALIPALDAGRPGLAVLDVTEPEPLPKGHPLWRHPRVRITPHVASLNPPDVIARSIRRSIRLFDAGDPVPGTVDMSRGY